MSVGVFVSYNHKDNKIADVFVESLTSLSPDLKVFIDHSGLEGGDDYEAKIARSIAESQWFVVICSGPAKSLKDMSWCFYEAGQFRAKLQAADQIRAVRDRMCYIYDVDRPSQLGRYQGHRIAETNRSRVKLNYRADSDDSIAYEDTDAFDLLRAILTRSADKPLRDMNDASVRKLMRAAVRRLALAFSENGLEEVVDEEVFQPRISFMVSLTETGGVRPETAVVGEYNALPNIFSIAGSSTTWADIRAKASGVSQSGQLPLWIPESRRLWWMWLGEGCRSKQSFSAVGMTRSFIGRSSQGRRSTRVA